jgi:hypothetical protein
MVLRLTGVPPRGQTLLGGGWGVVRTWNKVGVRSTTYKEDRPPVWAVGMEDVWRNGLNFAVQVATNKEPARLEDRATHLGASVCALLAGLAGS